MPTKIKKGIYMTVRELQCYIGMSKQGIINWIDSGRIKSVFLDYGASGFHLISKSDARKLKNETKQNVQCLLR